MEDSVAISSPLFGSPLDAFKAHRQKPRTDERTRVPRTGRVVVLSEPEPG
jgi:hypothetical protein